jgi:phenylalanine ammonia-lyase
LKNPNTVVVDGESLDLASVIFVAKHKGNAVLPSKGTEVIDRINKSVEQLKKHLKQGKTVYGVNTGFGGSADVRCDPNDMYTLQRAFLQHQHIGVLPMACADTTSMSAEAGPLRREWVRAAMLVRANSVARGHSAVRHSTIESLLTLLRNDIVPVIPTRGSISASGDLCPLSYIAGALEGNKTIHCWTGPESGRKLVPANEALASINLKPVVFEPKEALGLVNGTAISCGVGSLVLNSIHNLLELSQLLTAMNVEAMLGTCTSFAPFISRSRPHPGQAQVAATILSALQGSKLATPIHGSYEHQLFQDRYSIRTVPQWLGPFVEDLLLAHNQLTVEINSTTDNPLLDPDTGNIYHGGNFQAVSVTSAMEKCRLTAQAIGRMLFSQSTELTNHATNRGLPPNLCADDPSTSFTMKGVDIAMASYVSELGFLANPVFSHVVSAEMGNQALNSLALISARYTDSAIEILSMMCASVLYGVCQALDLRAMNRIFETRWKEALSKSIENSFNMLVDVKTIDDAKTKVWEWAKHELDKTTALDMKERFEKIVSGAKAPLLDAMFHNKHLAQSDVFSAIILWTTCTTESAIDLFQVTRNEYFTNGDASDILGNASRRLYRFIRRELGIPMHRGVVDYPTHPTLNATPGSDDTNHARIVNGSTNVRREKSMGQWISIIYESIKNNDIMDVVVECLEVGLGEDNQKSGGLNLAACGVTDTLNSSNIAACVQ